MNSKDILRAIGDIDDEFLKDEIPGVKKHKLSIFKVQYVLAPICAVVLTVVGLVKLNKLPIKQTNEKENFITDYSNTKILEESFNVKLKINKISNLSPTSEDIDIQEKENSNYFMIPYIELLSNLSLPSDLDNEKQYLIYTRSDNGKNEYDNLFNYKYVYQNTKNNRKITIAFSDKNKPLREYFYSDEGEITKLNNVEMKIDQYENLYMTTFFYGGYYFDIETNDISEEELTGLLTSIVSYKYNKNVKVKDKDVNIKEMPKENASKKYPSYYAGKYVDANGNNVILLCEDTPNNRKNICNFFNITESKTIFKTANFSYNYLENLQANISKAMENKELPFVVTSALMDTTNNIVVTVTSKRQEDLERVKKFDTMDGAIEIVYSENSIVHEDLLEKK